MQTVLITGANRGIGLEFARQYQSAGWDVIATHRQSSNARELLQIGVQTAPLEVDDARSRNALAEWLEGKKIDILLNNAGIMGDNSTSALDANLDQWTQAFETNVIAPAALTRLLLPNLTKSKKPVAATLGSQAGIFDYMTSGANCIYASTKAAAHAVTISLGHAMKEHGVTYVSLRPGPTKTGMLGDAAPYEVEDSVQLLRDVLAKVSINDTGKFLDRSGVSLPLHKSDAYIVKK